jgi:hypothetical protein
MSVWRIEHGLIFDGDCIVGSIANVGDNWRVEIVWSGPTGDITFEGTSIFAAMAFIDAVAFTEKGLDNDEPVSRAPDRSGKANRPNCRDHGED